MNRKNCAKMMVFLLITAAIVALTIASSAESGGEWLLSAGGNCPQESVCAEWDVGDASGGFCCVSPEAIGTDDLNACISGFSQGCLATE
ncbi:MAG TPA: hypothetical protein VGG06_13615 [Thermoanaerobaculia bacterium]|jgi:hypothetical protein